jgi:hypothetical protein
MTGAPGRSNSRLNDDLFGAFLAVRTRFATQLEPPAPGCSLHPRIGNRMPSVFFIGGLEDDLRHRGRLRAFPGALRSVLA